jgi:hypothetical protein
MKKAGLVILITALFVRCSSWVQVMDTESVTKGIEKVKEQGSSYVFQNDSLAITYTFWAKKGVMAFSVYNKLDIPIYIDWKKCSFISKDKKLNYWDDEKTVNGTSYTTGYVYRGSALFVPNYFGGTVSTQTISSPERVTFIPPRSYYSRGEFMLTPMNWYDIEKMTKTTIPSQAKPGKEVDAKIIELGYEKSPFIFRNFLTWSTKENFEKEIYLDHEFYVSKVTMVKASEFSTPSGNTVGGETQHYERNDRFYVYPYPSEIE